ncbi:unnamed protein product [Boreogadus saida]
MDHSLRSAPRAFASPRLQKHSGHVHTQRQIPHRPTGLGPVLPMDHTLTTNQPGESVPLEIDPARGFMRYLVIISQAFVVPECLNVFTSIVFTLRPASRHIPDPQSYIVQRWPCGTPPRPPHHSASIMEQGGSRSTQRPPAGESPPSFTPTLIPTLTSIAHDIPRYAEAASGLPEGL